MEINIVGLYRIIPTEESIAIAAGYHECDWLLDDNGAFVDEIHWSDHKELGLIEMQISGPFSPYDFLSKVVQGDQAPYMEFYLDPTGNSLISENEAAETEGRRVCFFLHFADVGKAVECQDIELALPTWSALPERLMPFTHYVPVD